MRAMRTEGFGGYKDLRLVGVQTAGGLGWRASGKNHSGRSHATRAHHSVWGIPASESAAGPWRRGSWRGGGGRGNGLSCRFTCNVYGAVWRFREWNLQ